MLMYASYKITHPLGRLKLKSLWVWIPALSFITLPGCGLFAVFYITKTSYSSYRFSIHDSALIHIGYIFIYGFSYFTTSALFIIKIRRFLAKWPGTNMATTKLVNTVVKNFLIALLNVVVVGATPLFVAIILSFLALPNASSIMFEIQLKTMTVYVTVSTVSSIFIFTPYRKYTLKMINCVLCFKSNGIMTVSIVKLSRTKSLKASGSKQTGHK
ncbi:hypothetical protein L596_020193 [Steinernema carpocapsae]|uniref:Uncharacterized protein n=1 Tax=Steinernema carpocapsae TaxID=34508 RepID=A0A4U5MST7_STECR|nr:hypothetical protein L596_020193 [Steinernema carpocapsae]